MFSVKLFVICLTNIISLLLFLYGYFPLQSQFRHPDSALPAELSSNFYQDLEKSACSQLDAWLSYRNHSRHKPLVENTVLIVIDALRFDFVLTDTGQSNNRMKFLTSLMQTGNVITYKATVQPPTVTMPRIKAITGGVVPTFADIVLNFASSSFDEDNVISIAKAVGRRLQFYGDDTWLRLFPAHFQRSVGVSSFVVTDYVEVDDNVTQNLDSALSHADQWDVMILHYLGLDHIGHTGGPLSPLVGVKLAEMDTVIQTIYNELKAKGSRFVLIVIGDHGMTDVGSHGGASQSETTVPLLFVAPNAWTAVPEGPFVQSIQQVDLAPTLSVILGLPIPVSSVGVALSSVIDHYAPLPVPIAHAIDQLRENAAQLLALYRNMDSHNANEGFDEYAVITKGFQNWLRERFCNETTLDSSSPLADAEDFLKRYRDLSEGIRSRIIAASVHYNEPALYLGTIGAFLAFILSFWSCFHMATRPSLGNGIINRTVYLNFGCLLHALSFASSSFIEEEHQTWYYFFETYVLLRFVSAVDSCRRSSEGQMKWPSVLLRYGVGLFFCRALRSWNRSGIKWRNLECFSDWLSQPNQWMLQWALIYGVGLAGCCVVACETVSRRRHKVMIAIAWILLLSCKADIVPPFWRIVAVRAVYAISALCIILRWSFVGALLLVLLLVKATNMPAIFFIILVQKLMTSQSSGVNAISSQEYICWNYYLAVVSFFALGNSNSIGHVDVASGFVGFTTYLPMINGILITLHLYAGPIAVLASAMRTDEPVSFVDTDLDGFYAILTLKGLPTALYLLVAYIHRYHLFVWSVFAPKLLYECMHMSIVCVSVLILQFRISATRR